MINSLSLPKDDLQHILNKTRKLFKNVYKKKFFLTGGTGFFGLWLLESFVWINERLKLDSSIEVLTRNPEIFKKNNPHFRKIKSVKFLKGDIRSFRFPKGRYHYVIHAATDNNPSSSSLDLFRNNIIGTQRALEFARASHNEAFLFISSGAVYGRQPSDMLNIPEDYQGAPLTMNINSTYGESKRVSEFYCANYAKEFGVNVKIARCFAFLGPHFPLDANFAIGNFIRDALNGKTIHVKSNKTVYRSYLYAADLMIWLWVILFIGKSPKPYNVGSSEAITILALAEKVAQGFYPKPKIKFPKRAKGDIKDIERYVPDTHLAENELGLRQFINLDEAIRRMVSFYRGHNYKRRKRGSS